MRNNGVVCETHKLESEKLKAQSYYVFIPVGSKFYLAWPGKNRK